ncbi:hypothetical protein B0T25DRAFT_537181 [Lasiosphaeria hispida]|uniref:O-fucosyltransferase family protein n=1 Tax=Lasiosphaeria hispida TaxID=260671 RepID=A0AAJ0HKQ7_9PEZI|nr:hypothetical protein B0T25DRAFT_537181 [Lasiosphaeria hispida]
MINFAMSRRLVILVATAILLGSSLLLVSWDSDSGSLWSRPSDAATKETTTPSKPSAPSTDPKSPTAAAATATAPTLLPHVENYFQQVFSASDPTPYDYPMLHEFCENAPWRDDSVYLKCGGMSAGLTSIVSQVKVCLKMAIDAGTHLVLPAMPLRDSDDLQNFNFLNASAYMTYDEWFDAGHLVKQMGRACPKMKIVHPHDLDKSVAVKHRFEMSCGDAWGYQKIHSYFWVGRPFRTFFDGQLFFLYTKANQEAEKAKTPPPKEGITVVDIDSEFLLYRITDDPTRRDLRLWNDLSHIVRFKQDARQIIDQLLSKLTRPHYGVHFRVEKDAIWSSLDHQLEVDLDALDKAWSRFGHPEREKPLVYLACGSPTQVEKFVEAGKKRGWDVTHKWRLVEDDAATTKLINDLPFDFQGAVDMGVMVRSEFLIGIQGSAFSSTIANQRDVTGRYRGSSFEMPDDEGARTHLFNDLDATEYACCL